MNRRDFLKRSSLMIGGCALGSIGFSQTYAGQESRSGDPPDVLFIAIEDLATYMGCYGHPMVKTPNIDALAKRGVLFANGHCQTPVCNPSRASVATGLRPETTKVYGNSKDWRRAIPEGMLAMPEFFRDQGYQVVRCGKIHHHPRYFNDATEEAQQREDRFWHKILRSRSKKIAKPPIVPKAPRPDFLKEDDYTARSLNWGPTGLGDTEQVDGAIATAVAAELMEEHDKPLFMAVGFHSPHYSLRAPDRYFDMYPPESIVLPKNPPDDLDDVPIKYPKFNTTDEIWLDEGEKRQAIAAYYCCISYVDTCVGILMDALRRSGREDKTMICLWGDHGMHFGEHYLWRKLTLFENATRVPFIMVAPEIAEPGVCHRPVELIDMYPTLADLCGFQVPGGLEAISMKPLLEDPRRQWKKAAFTYRSKGTSIRTERWRYTDWGQGKMELYDHETDPGEFTNLASNPEYADVVAELSELLKGGWRAALPE